MDTHIRGTTMPMLEVRLDPGESVVAESGRLGWMNDGLELSTSSAVGGADGLWDAAKRSFSGGSFFMTTYSATTEPGIVTFPASLPGTIFPVALGQGQSYLIQQRGFLAGTPDVVLTSAFQTGHLGTALFGGFGIALQRLEGEGSAWVELAGEVVEYDLQAGQSLRVHPGHIGLVEGSVAYELTTVPGIKNKLLGGDGLFLVKLSGPGKVWLQSLSLDMLALALAPYLPQQQHENGSSGLTLGLHV
jgi:uncharacterized protein (TIGR00266 family)